MPYDALGNYVPGDDTPTSDDMSYATSVPTAQSYQQQRMARVPQNLQGMGAPARGLTDLLTGAAKGTLAATVGAPGDISQMLRDMSPEVRAVMERKFGSRSFPTTQETLPYIPSTNLSGTNVGETGTTLGSNIVAPLAGPQLLGAAARGTAKAAKAAAPSVAQMAAELMEKQGLGPMYVVKPNKGGNWLKDEVEHAVKPLKSRTPAMGPFGDPVPYHLQDIASDNPVNAWIDKKLVPYIKNEMGTPEDPVRLGIEKRVADAEARKAQGEKRIAKLQTAVAEGERLGAPSQLTRDRLATEIDNVANQYNTDMASVMHSDDLNYNNNYTPRNQMSTTAQSKHWEGASDIQIGENKAGELIEEKPFLVTGPFNARLKTREEAQAYLDRLNKLGEFAPELAKKLRLYPPKIVETGAHIENPWLKKVASDTPVYRMSTGVDDDLQFKHLTDELKNALNPQSGLPPELLLSPNKMPKTVDDAIAHVGKINAWRARNMANAQIKITEGMPVHKQYPEGYKWLELTKPKLPDVLPDALPEGYTVKPTEKEGWFSVHEPPSENYPNGRSTGAVGRSPEEAIANHDFSRDALDKALKYEGATMGHCVGSYCEDVESGRSRIYSLRDAKGEPHVTVEVMPKSINNWKDVKALVGPEKGEELLGEFSQLPDVSEGDTYRKFIDFIESKGIKAPEIINQIKGKGDGAVKEKYWPYVHDFVKSQPWSKVRELENAGLMPFKGGYITEPEFKAYTKSVIDPAKEWYYNSPYHQTYKQDFDRKSDLYKDLNQWSERTNIPVGRQKFSISDINGVLSDTGGHDISTLENVRDAVDWLKANQPEIPKHLLPETPPTKGMKDGGIVHMKEGGRAIPNGFDLNQYMPSAPANAQPIATEPTPQATIEQMRAELQRAKEGTQALSAQFPSVKPAFPDLGKAYGATEAAGNMLYNTAIAVPGAFGAVGKSINDYAAGRTPYPATSLDTHMGDFMQQYGSAPSTPTGQEYYNKASEVLSNIPPVMPELHAAPSIAQMKAELQYGAAKAAPHAGKAVHNILEAQGLGPSYVVPPESVHPILDRLQTTVSPKIAHAASTSKETGKPLVQHLTDKERDTIMNASLILRRSQLGDIFGPNGRLLNVHESGKTTAAAGAKNSIKIRSEWEPQFLGGTDINYGYLTSNPLSTTKLPVELQYNKKGDPYLMPADDVIHYGSYGLELGPEARSRSTFTLGDSLDGGRGNYATAESIINPPGPRHDIAQPGSILHDLAKNYWDTYLPIIDKMRSKTGVIDHYAAAEMMKELGFAGHFRDYLAQEGFGQMGANFPRLSPRPINDPRSTPLMNTERFNLGVLDRQIDRSLPSMGADYIEGQVHGGVQPQDVTRLYDFNYEPSLAVEKRAKKFGIEYVPMPNDTIYSLVQKEQPKTKRELAELLGPERFRGAKNYLPSNKSQASWADAPAPKFGKSFKNGGVVHMQEGGNVNIDEMRLALTRGR